MTDKKIEPTTEQIKVEINKDKSIKIKWNGKDNRRYYPHNLHTAILEGKWTLSQLKLIQFVYDRGWGYPENDGWTKPTSIRKISEVVKVSRQSLTSAAITLQEKRVLIVSDGQQKYGADVFSFKLNPHFDTWQDCDIDNYIEWEKQKQHDRMKQMDDNSAKTCQ